MVHPCCTLVSLESASKVVAIIDAIGGMFGAVTTGIVLIALLFFRAEIKEELDDPDKLEPNLELQRFMEQPESVQYSMIGFTLIICILEIIVAIVLFKGARSRNVSKCSVWFRVHLVLFILSILFTIVAVVTASEKIIISVGGVTGLIYQAYTLWIVKAFVVELSMGRRTSTLDDEQGQPLQIIERKE